MGSRRECTRIPGLDGFRVATIEWEGDGAHALRHFSDDRGSSRVQQLNNTDDRESDATRKHQSAWPTVFLARGAHESRLLLSGNLGRIEAVSERLSFIMNQQRASASDSSAGITESASASPDFRSA
jgi:hypothetical protein